VAISFFTEPLVWHDTVGPYLIAAPPAAGAVGPVYTLQLQACLAIHSLLAVPADAHPNDAR